VKIIDFLENKSREIFLEAKEETLSIEPSEVITALLLVSGTNLSALKDPTAVDVQKILKAGLKTKKVILADAERYILKVNDYGASLSAAIKIKKIIGSKAIKHIILSGRGTTGMALSKRVLEVINFSPANKKMRAYNPADLLIETARKIYGVSLKKKARTNTPDPTVINRSLMDFSKSTFNTKIQKELDDVRIKYFASLLKIKSANPTQKEIIAAVKKMDAAYEEKKKSGKKGEDKRPSQTFFNAKLLSENNVFFKTIDTVLTKNKTVFLDAIVKEAFRIELKDLLANDFEFFIVTGEGHLTPKGVIKVDPGKYYDFASAIEVLDDLLTKRSLTIGKTKGKTHAFESGATSAKLFYTIYANKVPIFNIDMRYKGKFESNPQFFVFPTKQFVEVFKHG